MILATLLLGARFIELRDGPSFTAFCYSALLLAQVRYESAIFLVPVVLHHPLGLAPGGQGDPALAGHGGAAPHDPLRAPQPDLRPALLGVAAPEQAGVHEAVLALLHPGQPRARVRLLLRQADGPAELARALGPGLHRDLLPAPPRREAPEGAVEPSRAISVAIDLLHPRLRGAARAHDVLLLGALRRPGDPAPEPADAPLDGDRGHGGPASSSRSRRSSRTLLARGRPRHPGAGRPVDGRARLQPGVPCGPRDRVAPQVHRRATRRRTT